MAPSEAPAGTSQPGCQFFATVAQWLPFQMFGDTYTTARAADAAAAADADADADDAADADADATIASVPFSFEQYWMGSSRDVVARRALTHPATSAAEVDEAKGLFSVEFDRRLLELRKTTQVLERELPTRLTPTRQPARPPA